MSDQDVEHDALRQRFEVWERNELAAFLARSPERKQEFLTESGIPLKRVSTPLDASDAAEIGLPGQSPSPRGPYPTMFAGGCGQCAFLLGMARARTPTRGLSF